MNCSGRSIARSKKPKPVCFSHAVVFDGISRLSPQPKGHEPEPEPEVEVEVEVTVENVEVEVVTEVEMVVSIAETTWKPLIWDRPALLRLSVQVVVMPVQPAAVNSSAPWAAAAVAAVSATASDVMVTCSSMNHRLANTDQRSLWTNDRQSG